MKERGRLRFDHESLTGALPYTPRHRKGLLTARGGWRPASLLRTRLSQAPGDRTTRAASPGRPAPARRES